MEPAMHLLVDRRGVIRCVYDEALDLTALGQVCIRRGSHIEPDADGRWWADLAPVAGPRLGPFAWRSQALDAEQHWLLEHWLQPPDNKCSASDAPGESGMP
jgi:hypothetical protein